MNHVRDEPLSSTYYPLYINIYTPLIVGHRFPMAHNLYASILSGCLSPLEYTDAKQTANKFYYRPDEPNSSSP